MGEVRAGKLSVSLAVIEKMQTNILLNAFRIAVNGSLTQFNMVDGIIDEYEDESGIDTINSINELYDAADDFYQTDTGALPTDTRLLLHLDDSDGATSTIDSGPGAHSITFVDNAQLDADEKKFGTASLLLDGSGDYLSIPHNSDFNFDNGDTFTLETWLYLNSVSGDQVVISKFLASAPFTGYNWRISNDTMIVELTSTNSGAQSITVVTGNILTTGSWVHFAVTYDGSGLAAGVKLYMNGVSQALGVTADNLTFSMTNGHALHIGASPNGATVLNGQMDEVLITGTVKYAADFTPPSVPYGTPQDMTLISNNFTAVEESDSARLVLFTEDIDVVLENVDIVAAVSRDGGTTYTNLILQDLGDYEDGRRILAATVDIGSQPSGTNMKYKVTTFNNKGIKIHGAGLSWE